MQKQRQMRQQIRLTKKSKERVKIWNREAKLKNAKFEATKEIQKYREEEEKKYQEQIAKVHQSIKCEGMGNRNELEELEKTTADEIKEISQQYTETRKRLSSCFLTTS